MNCVLTTEQQKQLFKKVFVDLTSNKLPFSFTEYVEDFYDMVLDNTDDKALALSYVALLPQNIRINMAASKNLSYKYAGYFPQIVEMERKFTSLDYVENLISEIKIDKTGLSDIKKELQNDTLRPEKNTQVSDTSSTVSEINTVEPSVGLTDLTFETPRAGGDFISPDKKLYANIKRQLIKNVKQDGTSFLDGFGVVKLRIVSTQTLQDKDLYPDTIRDLQNGDEQTKERIRKGNETGAVLIVMDLDNNVLYFDENGNIKPKSEGKPAFFLFRNPQPNAEGKFVLSEQDKIAIENISQDLKLNLEQAREVYLKKIGVYKNIRKYINENPKQNAVDVNIVGGFLGTHAKPDNSIKTPLSGLNTQGKPFYPYLGVEAKGQNVQSYYFDLPGLPTSIQIRRPEVSKDFAEKLASLLFDDVVVDQRGVKTPLAASERIRLFEQFVYTSPITISFKVDPDGKIVMRKFGEIVPVGNISEYKQTLIDYLTRLQPSVELSKDKIGTRKIITDLSEAKTNYVYKTSVEGKDRYFLIQPAQLEISKTAAKNNAYTEFSLNPVSEGVLEIKQESKPYFDFIKNNFVINYPLDDAGNIQTVNAVLNFDLPVDSVQRIAPNKKQKQEAVTEVEKKEVEPNLVNEELAEPVRKLSAKDFLAAQRKKNPNTFNKLIDQKGLEATEAQIADAIRWYQNHPMSKYFPFEAAFGVINLSNPNAIATWTTNGITLYKGADYSDLYHEAWHGFTQGFLNKKEKSDLYKEVSKKSGYFTDYVGNRVKFSNATELQIEEYLAEDFRNYMQSGGKKVFNESPVKNTLFKKILNFLRSLFGGTSYNDSLIDANVNRTIKTLYDKLRLGDLTQFNFSVENRNFNTLNKGIVALNKIDLPSLSFENSKLILDSVDSLFSEYADLNNSYSEESADSEKAPKQTYKYTTRLFETPQGLSATYEYVKFRLAEIHDDLKSKESPSQDVINQIDLLKWAIRNFGNAEDLFRNSEQGGVIGYHLVNSNYIPSSIKEDLQDEEDLAGRETEGKNYYDRGGNERSIFDLANKEIINIIRGLPKYDSSDKIVYNKLGLPELNPFKESFAHIAKTVQNLSTPQKMYEALTKEVENYPTLKHLLEKLGPVSYEGQSVEEVNNWTRFWQTFNKYRIPLIQTTVNKIVAQGKIGQPEKITYEIQIGNAVSDFGRVGQRWENQFAQTTTNPFIKNNTQGNYLDLEEVLKKYPQKSSINGKEFEFLTDIGIPLKDSKTVRNELKKEIESGSIKLGGIYDNLHILQNNGIIVRSISRYIRKDNDLKIAGEGGAKGNYGKLQKLQYRFADEDSDFMVVNAAGDPQSEFSQNTTLTQMLKFINESENYSELISKPQMSFLNRTPLEPGKPYNPFVESSVWMNSIYDMNNAYGPKYPGAGINVINLSGLTKATNGVNIGEGSISTELDEYSKLIQDFHTQLLTGVPELTRHAGKKTSLSVTVNNYKTYPGKETPYLYIDTEAFALQTGDLSQGYIKGVQIIMPYVLSELKRIKYAKDLLKNNSGVELADFGALKRAAEFSRFSGVLAKDTQEKLLKHLDNIDEYFKSSDSVDLRNDVENDIINYFAKLSKKVENKFSKAEYISPALLSNIKNKVAATDAQWAYDANIRQALINSFVWNNWIHHFEESTMLYGDPSLYKNEQDFFKRNAALNSTGDILRTDEDFLRHVNANLGKPLSAKLGASSEVINYNGIFNSAIVSDVEVGSAYYEEYKKALPEAVIDEKYGPDKVNEADAAAFVTYDTYRIIRTALGKWEKEDEELYQKELNGESIKNVDKFPAVVKMGYYGPLETSYLPLQALHKFALFPLIPSVIRGTNLENLHNKMMMEGVDYLTFKSGSKISTITKNNVSDKLYSNTKTRQINQDQPFTKNPVYADYLKDQVEASTHFKGKVSFFSQLRKLIDTGLMENGIPVDYKSKTEDWYSLSESEKLIASPKYKKRRDFLNTLNKLQDFKRNQLLSELGWKLDKNGKPTGDIKSLLELISRELKRRDFPEHTWQFIQTIKDNQIKNSLDISQFAEQIEGVVMAIVNKRLVNFKVNGEQLVQVSATGFENLAFAYGEGRNFEKPTQADLEKYGTNDLPTYHKLADGTTSAAKVKIAIQGQFKSLLKLPDVLSRAKEGGVSPLQALNQLLKDEEWLSKEDNRAMITMIGARIPTQGLNSMEFVEVYEFLPEEAGSIIIAPTEITAKSGTDFDYDKLPMMMPNISVKAGKVGLAKEYSKTEAKKLYDTLVEYGVTKASLEGVDLRELKTFMSADRFNKFESAMIKLWGDDYLDNLVSIVKEDNGLVDFDVFFENLNGSAAIENQVIQSVKNILSDPDNFVNLIRPNSTELIEPLAKETMAPLVTDSELLQSGSKGTAIYEPLKNLQIHQSNTIGKRTLGIVAIENTYKTIFNGIDMKLNPFFTKGKGKKEYRAAILLPHNSEKLNKSDVISLGGLKDAAGENNIADVISQLMNGTVDVEKDDWVSFIQMNEEVAPVILFLAGAGVPIKDIIYFVSQPLIRQYVTEQRLYASSFADTLGKISANPFQTRISARNSILSNPAYNFQIGDKLRDATIYDQTINETAGIKEFDREDLVNNLKKYQTEVMKKGEQFKPGDLDRQTFLHYLELENIVKELQKLKLATNVDTNASSTLFEMEEKKKAIEKASSGNLFPQNIVEQIKTNSAITPYFIQDFASDVFGRLFPLRNNPVVNDYISDMEFPAEASKLFKDRDTMVKSFKNDLISYIFQNGTRAFSLEGLKTYKDYDLKLVSEGVSIEKNSAVVKGDTIYVDWAATYLEFETREYENQGLSSNTFASLDEYQHFVVEREALRSVYKLGEVINQIDYQAILRKNMRKSDLRKEGQTDEQFKDMVEKMSYDEWLRNQALYNILNPWILFRSGASVADKLMAIYEKYPALRDKYSFLKGIQYSEGTEGYRNLKISGAKIDAITAEIYHENLKDLTNNSVAKVDNPQDNKYISDFFNNFSVWMFMQSGLSSNNPYSFAKVISQDAVVRLLDGPYKKVLSEISPEYLDKFKKAFILQNSNKSSRLRSKNYLKSDLEVVYAGEISSESGTQEEAPTQTKPEKITISKEELTNLLSQCYRK